MFEVESIRKMAAFCREYGVESLKIAGCEISMYPVAHIPKQKDEIPFPEQEKKTELSGKKLPIKLKNSHLL